MVITPSQGCSPISRTEPADGDLGTSPLYVFAGIFADTSLPVSEENVVGKAPCPSLSPCLRLRHASHVLRTLGCLQCRFPGVRADTMISGRDILRNLVALET